MCFYPSSSHIQHISKLYCSCENRIASKFRSSNFSITLKGCFRVKKPFFVFGAVVCQRDFLVNNNSNTLWCWCVLCDHCSYAASQQKKLLGWLFLVPLMWPVASSAYCKSSNHAACRLVTQFVVRLYNCYLRTAINYFGQQKITFLFRSWDALTVRVFFNILCLVGTSSILMCK